MKHKDNLLIIPTLIAAISANELASARENVGLNKISAPQTMNAACTESIAQSDLTVNNVRCRVLMGDLWWNPNDNSRGIYEIPKGSNLNSIYAGSLWIGGIDVGGQIKVAAQTYRQTGNDFWPGPLDVNNASVDLDVCAEYDKHFRITRKEVETFVSTGVSTPAITNWKGNGDPSKGQALALAPFFDENQNGIYEPSLGDYPGYDLVAGDNFGDCQQVNCIPVDQLFGDETLWWVFNDKGNIHTETGGEAIGLEVRAQAFGFFTDDEINNMTFYNYRIFNRSTYQVDSCYFGVWCDADLGEATDDYVGCDVKRGLGYTYNSDDDDAPPTGYGANPPAVGIDFFRGPIADTGDGKDNDRNSDSAGICLPQYVDELCEQISMSGFLYYDNTNSVPYGNPSGATHFYNYLKMKWGDGTPVVYNGANGYGGGGPVCNFMYPGNPTTDEHDWGIGGNCSTIPTLPAWDEVTAGNAPQDRRMLESAGPFTLLPGAVNVITTGVVWARATAGGPQASVKLLKVVDDKAQALFDNCFKVLDGPSAPDLTIQELDKELILYLSNTDPNSNNYNETYTEFDPLISLIDSNGNSCPTVDKYYHFEGYKIYQLKNATVSSSDLENPDKARLVYQCDLKNGIGTIINFEFDQTLNGGVPKLKVTGADAGIAHSLRITTDAFVTGPLVNHKTYYFMAVAYGYNQFKKYQQDMPPTNLNMCDAAAGASTGQKKPYKQGRKNLLTYSAIPHIPDPGTGGTELHSEYGSGVSKITRIEGSGNGGMVLDFASGIHNAILSSADNLYETPEYENGKGPINVKVIDPLNVSAATFTLWFIPDTTPSTTVNIANAMWKIKNNSTNEIISSDRTIKLGYEQLLLQWGISATIEQISQPGSASSKNNGFLEASMSSNSWLTGFVDGETANYSNWIRAGSDASGTGGFAGDYILPSPIDEGQYYEGVIGGTWAPYRLCATSQVTPLSSAKYYGGPGWKSNLMSLTQMSDLASVDVVITSDQSKWSRCVVLETCDDPALSEGGQRKLDKRIAPSVDKNGNPDGTGTGMGWFPGYAVNLETGERLNICFGENSALTGAYNQNGRDMKWNPTSVTYAKNPWDSSGTGPVQGGMHYIYVFGHNREQSSGTAYDVNVPRYDEGFAINSILNGQPGDGTKRKVFKDAMWVNIPILASGHNLLESDVTIRLRVGKSYKKGYSPAYSAGIPAAGDTVYSDTSATAQNDNYPMYKFSTEGLETHIGQTDIAKEALELIKVVPNPYYAFSAYETGSLDNRVKITNLPEKCTVSIYNLGGTLIRRFKKAESNVNHTPKGFTDPDNAWHDGSLDWDLKNIVGIPISGGVYIIHVDVPDVGEKIVKWFGIMRPIDLDSF